MALMSFATTPTFYRVGEIVDGFTGVHIFGTGMTYVTDPTTGADVPVTGTVTSMRFYLDGIAVVAMRDLPVTSIPLLAADLGDILAVLDSGDPADAFDAVFEAFEGATFVDLALGNLTGSDSSDDILQARASGGDLFGEGGDDELRGSAGEDGLFGGAGNDALFGGANGDFMSGEEGDDLINAGSGNDFVFFLEGEDEVRAGAGDDVVFAGDIFSSSFGATGDDIVFGGSGNDELYMSDGDDRIFGGANDDSIYTGSGRDVVRGGSGNDEILFGTGQNQIFGGSGEDVFLFEGAEIFEGGSVVRNAGDISTIRDFDAGDDIIVQSSIGVGLGGPSDATAELAAFLAQASEVGDDVLWTDAVSGQRVLIKDLELSDLSIDNFAYGAPLVAL